MLCRQPKYTLFPYTTLFRSRLTPPPAKLPPGSGDGAILFAEDEEALASAVQSLLESRSEEHTSELQSHHDLVCRLLLEKKKQLIFNKTITHRIELVETSICM